MRKEITGKPSIELILHDEVQKLLDVFAASLKVRVVLYGPDGKIIRTNHQLRNSEYCQLIQKKIFSPELCASLDSRKQEECLRQKELVCYQCHAGLKEAISPVMIDNRLAGFIMIGQFRDITRIPSHVLSACPSSSMRTRLKKSFSTLPYIPTGQLNDILGMFMMLVDYIVARELVGLRGDWIHEKISQYIDRNLAENIKVGDVARHTGRSVSSLSHLLSSKYGTTFKKLVIEKRLSRAEEMLRSNPELSIGEIAFQVGFEDRLYFSRIYRKYRKATPSQFREGK